MKTKSALRLRREECLRKLSTAQTQGDVLMALVNFAEETAIKRAVFNAMTIITAEYGSDPQVSAPVQGAIPSAEIAEDATVELPEFFEVDMDITEVAPIPQETT